MHTRIYLAGWLDKGCGTAHHASSLTHSLELFGARPSTDNPPHANPMPCIARPHLRFNYFSYLDLLLASVRDSWVLPTVITYNSKSIILALPTANTHTHTHTKKSHTH